MDTLTEVNLLTFLRKNYPHLYEFQREIKRVVEETGYGEVSVHCTVRNKKVFSTDVGGWVKTLFKDGC